MGYRDKNLTQLELYTYKYVGDLSKDHIELMAIDMEVYKPFYVEDSTIEDIKDICAKCTKLRVYYSRKFRQFLIEPVKEVK